MRYIVTVTRDDDLWVAKAATADGGHIGVLDFVDFADVHQTMPEFIADMTDPGEVTLDWRYEVNGIDVTATVRRFLDLTQDLRHVQQERDRARKQALAALSDAGLSQRVMADVVDLSHQRVNQLVHSG